MFDFVGRLANQDLKCDYCFLIIFSSIFSSLTTTATVENGHRVAALLASEQIRFETMETTLRTKLAEQIEIVQRCVTEKEAMSLQIQNHGPGIQI